MNHFFSMAIIIASYPICLLGQDFGAPGSEWYYSEHASGGCMYNCEYFHLESVSDSTINGYSCRKISQTYFKNNGDTIKFNPLFLYQESDTVFVWSPKRSKFLKTYVFNGSVGDTLTLDAPDDVHSWTDSTYRLVIDTIISTTIDGIALKKYGTVALDDYKFLDEGGYFMDRIGGLVWFFPRAASFPEERGPIRCYKDSHIDTNFQTVACDYIATSVLNELHNKTRVSVFPNPAGSTLTVETSEALDRLELLNLNGGLIKTSYKPVLDLTEITSGLYILTVGLKTGEKIQKKIMIGGNEVAQ